MALLLVAVGLFIPNCGSEGTRVTAPTTLSSPPSATPAPTPGPAPTPAPSPPPQTGTISGMVRDGQGGTPLSQVTVEIVGPEPRTRTRTDGSGRYSITGRFTGGGRGGADATVLQFSREGFTPAGIRTGTVTGTSTLDVTLLRTCAVTPTGLRATVSSTIGNNGWTLVLFEWTPVADATEYFVDVRSSASVEVLSEKTKATSYLWNPGRGGFYYVRVGSHTSCGLSPLSDEVQFIVTGSTPTCGTSTVRTPVDCGTATARCADLTWTCSAIRIPNPCAGRGGIACGVCPGPFCASDGFF